MRILGIETSCDETAASVVEDGRTVLSNVLATSAPETARYGGVFPEVAARKQIECIVPVVQSALRQAQEKIRNSKFEAPARLRHSGGRNKSEIRNSNTQNGEGIDAIAVTRGPGLLTSLLVGTMAARALASVWKKPLIGVHHTMGHLSSTWLRGPPYQFTSELVCPQGWELVGPSRTSAPQYTSILRSSPQEFPTLALSVSGGHTELWLRESHTKGTLLGRTLDDAAGEAFDKGAVQLGLPYPGGPALSRMAEGGDAGAVKFPSPLAGEETCDFSFAGLKTALKYHLRDRGGIASLSREEIRGIAASYQETICEHLVSRVERAMQLHPHVREVHLVGGVSANLRLRTLLQKRLSQVSTVNCQLSIRWPAAIEFCTDNAAMIAGAAYFMVQELGEQAFAPFETEASVQLTASEFSTQ